MFKILISILLIANHNWVDCLDSVEVKQDCSKRNETKIMYWYGKVNQHSDRTTGFSWQTDCDGKSGANLDPLEYCKKFQPKTRYVKNCINEISKTWRENGNTGGPYINSRDSSNVRTYECFAENPDEKVPRIMMWYGRVNQHNDITTGWTWQTDCDGVSGADIDKLTYCRKYHPNTISVRELGPEVSPTWRNRGNTDGPFTNKQVILAYECVQP